MELFLLILKITGITLLIIAGLLILIVLAVLFVPIRYGAYSIRKAGVSPFCARLNVHWFLHIVGLYISYDDGLSYVLKIFGIPVKKSGGSSDEGSGKDKKRKRAKKKNAGKRKAGHLKEKDTETVENEPEALKQEPAAAEAIPETEVQEAEAVPATEVQEAEAVPETEVQEAEAVFETEVKEAEAAEAVETAEGTASPTVEAAEEIASAAAETEKAVFSEADVTEAEAAEKEESAGAEEGKASFLSRLSDFYKRLSGMAVALKEKLVAIIRVPERLINDLNVYIDFLSDENTKEQLSNIYSETKKLLGHIKPVKYDIYLLTGNEDPYVTGSILAVLAIISPVFGRALRVEPCFDRNITEFEAEFRGRVVVFTVLLILYRVFYHKGFKEMKARYMELSVR